MDILDLANELNLSPKKSASTNGGEYKSACPNCQTGTDRFCIWPNQGKLGRYWCRACDTKGDAIQFCRDFLGLSFQNACQKLNVSIDHNSLNSKKKYRDHSFIPSSTSSVSAIWQETVMTFVSSAHTRLLNQPEALDLLFKRGFKIATIKKFALGWNPDNLFDKRENWGLKPELKKSGFPKRQWLPKGIVIPSYSESNPIKLKIRRSDWFEGDSFPKYIEVSGSKKSLSIYGDVSKPVIIVESELDAMLIQQEASHLVCCVALGGVSKKPDAKLHEWLRKVPLILLSLDFDEAGKTHHTFWMKHYPNLRLWPVPLGKSPGDYKKIFNTDFCKWITTGIYNYKTF